MPRQKNELQKHTLNLRPGDFDKMGELFDDLDASTAIRTLVARFVDNNYTASTTEIDDKQLPLEI